MFLNVLIVLHWSFSLGAKFLRIVPWTTCCIVFLTIVSQVAVLLAYFLPLKVVVLLGSSNMPRYFPSAWQSVDRDTLILLLSGAAALLYLGHLLCEKLISTVTSYGATQLLLRSQKLVLFENQEEIAGKAYLRYTSVLSSAMFGCLAVLVLYILYPAMALVAPGVLLFFFCVAWGICVAIDRAGDFLGENLISFASLYSGLGFFIGFAYLVADFIFFDPPGLISAVIALLLLRQFFRRTSSVLIDISGLFKQRHKLDALFFHGRVFVPQEKLDKQKEVWQLLDPRERSDWVLNTAAALREKGAGFAASGDWLDTGVTDVFALQYDGAYIFKLFDKKRTNRAQHEAFLLESSVAIDLPALKLVVNTVVEGHPCHVFETASKLHKLTGRYSRNALCAFWSRLVSVVPPATVASRYRRSHLSIWQRFNAEHLLRLSWTVSDISHREKIFQLAEELPSIKRRLMGMPVVFVNPDAGMCLYSSATSGKTDEMNAVCMYWGRWGVEPLGAYLPVLLRERAKLRETLQSVSKIREDFIGVSPEDVLLVAYFFELEMLIEKQRWREAVDTVFAVIDVESKRSLA